MINKESWHQEVASFEKQREFLYRQYMHGDITPEEFAKRMLRFWKEEHGQGSQLEERDGQFYMTADWMYAHKPWLDRARKVGDEWIESIGEADRIGRLLGVSTDLRSPRFISEIVTQGKFDMVQVRNARNLWSLIMDLGSPVLGYFQSGDTPPWETGAEFDQWYLQTLQNGEEIVRMFREYLELVNSEVAT